MRTVLTIGAFDCLHAGHINLFRRCEEYGELIVGLNSDDFIEKYKGKRPLFSYDERVELLENLGYKVVKNSDAGYTIIRGINPDLLVVGSDWARKDYLAQIGMTQDDLDELNIHLMYVPYTKIISTSEIKRRVLE